MQTWRVVVVGWMRREGCSLICGVCTLQDEAIVEMGSIVHTERCVLVDTLKQLRAGLAPVRESTCLVMS